MKAMLLLMISFMLVACPACGKKDTKKKPSPDEIATPLPDPTPPQNLPPPEEPPVVPDPGPNPDPEPLPAPEPDPEPLPVPSTDLSQTFSVNVQFFGSMATPARIDKYKQAMALLKRVVATTTLKDKILNFDSPCTVNLFVDSSESRASIYRHILEGNETLQPDKDNELDVEVEFYYAATSTVGYTYGNSRRIWVNTKFFDKYTPPYVADNLMHEWLHKLGYKHSSAYNTCRQYSVPYAIGYITEDIAKTLK